MPFAHMPQRKITYNVERQFRFRLESERPYNIGGPYRIALYRLLILLPLQATMTIAISDKLANFPSSLHVL